MTTETDFPEMTIEEIETQFDGEWVLVGDVAFDEKLEVVRSKVLIHNQDATQFDIQLMELGGLEDDNFAVLYNGEPSAEMRACYSNFGVVR